MMFDKCIDALPHVRGLRGRPRRWPSKLHADKGYDYAKCRAHLRSRGISSRIARRDIESSERLGKHPWVVERTHAWFAGFGKLRIGATLTIGNYLATLIVADYLKRHPSGSAELHVRNTASIVEQVARHELDVGLVERVDAEYIAADGTGLFKEIHQFSEGLFIGLFQLQLEDRHSAALMS